MRLPIILALLLAQIAAGPSAAADLSADRSIPGQQAGAFAGARLRIPIGGRAGRAAPRAGLVVAPMMSAGRSDGSRLSRIGEGVEFGLRHDRAVGLSIAGTPVGGRHQVPEGANRAGVSTLGWVAIGVGVVVAIVVAASVICVELNCLGSK